MPERPKADVPLVAEELDLIDAVHAWDTARNAADAARADEQQARARLVAALKACGVEGFSL